MKISQIEAVTEAFIEVFDTLSDAELHELTMSSYQEAREELTALAAV